MLTVSLQCLSKPCYGKSSEPSVLQEEMYYSCLLPSPPVLNKKFISVGRFSPRVFLSNPKEYLFGNWRGKRGFYMGVIWTAAFITPKYKTTFPFIISLSKTFLRGRLGTNPFVNFFIIWFGSFPVNQCPPPLSARSSKWTSNICIHWSCGGTPVYVKLRELLYIIMYKISKFALPCVSYELKVWPVNSTLGKICRMVIILSEFAWHAFPVLEFINFAFFSYINCQL